ALAADAEVPFGGAVAQTITQIRNRLDDDRRRHSLDDHVEELPRLLEPTLGALAFGDNLVRGNPTAACHGLIDDGDDAAVAELDCYRECLAGLERGAQIGIVALGIERKCAGGDAGG